MRLIRTASILLAVTLLTTRVHAQASTDSLAAAGAARLDSLLRANSLPLRMTAHGLEGPGHDALLHAFAGAQFVAVGERHGIREIPEFVRVLLRELHARNGFQALATENGERVTWMALSAPPYSAMAFAKRYPMAFEFGSDQDLALLDSARVILGPRTSNIWGIDQEFGARHLLDRLRTLGVPAPARTRFDSLSSAASVAEAHALDQGGRHWLATEAEPESFSRLARAFGSSASGEAREILRSLEASARLYRYDRLSNQGQLTGFLANDEREEMMKRSFARQYEAATRGGVRPKVLVKMGSAHLGRGQSPFGPFTVGMLLSDLALANGGRSVHLIVLAHNAPADSSAPSLWGWKALRPLAVAAPTTGLTLFDLAPLRPFLYAGRLGAVEADLRRIIYGYDFALLIGGAADATQTVTRRTTP
jgi:hypothetical protein